MLLHVASNTDFRTFAGFGVLQNTPRPQTTPFLSSVYHLLAYGTRARSARGSQNCAILSILCPFNGNGAHLRVNDVVVDLPCRKDVIKEIHY